MSKCKKLVHGVGYNDFTRPSKNGKTITREYDAWSRMLFRCTKDGIKHCPSYNGCMVSTNFLSYTFFYDWCQAQIGFDNKDENNKSWNLDKDLLVKGNKIYSEDTCVFIPASVNMRLVTCKKTRGDYPVGVCFSSYAKKFCASCNMGKRKTKYLGYFDDPKQAFLAYKTFKEALIKEVANEYKDQIDPRAYQALINYEVNIND